jgi:cytochrome b subunit of formate dehydrogenase
MNRLARTVFLLVLAVAGAAAAQPARLEPELACRCHGDVQSLLRGAGNLHEKLTCTDCHPGRFFAPHVSPQVGARAGQASTVFGPVARHSPAAFTSCAKCHEKVVAAWTESVHGLPGKLDAEGVKRPSCVDCHGAAHAMTRQNQIKAARAERCIRCHGFADKGKPPTPAHIVDTYRDTIHGKLLRLGSSRVAACADCHTSHSVLPAADPRSTVHESNRRATCAKCHPRATESFARAVSHTPHTIDEDFWTGLTAFGFSVLTVGTIALLFVHVILDFIRAGREALRRRREGDHHEPQAEKAPLAADDPVPRFDIHMRIQHWGMMASLIALAITGWPLKSASLRTSAAYVTAIGGQDVARLMHRVAGALLIAVSVYHVGYLAWLLRKGRLTLQMVPSPRDLGHVFGNLAYFVGLARERPHFGRWTYYEKFDYWAVFWGMFIMGGSGLVLWFPVAASHLLSAKLIAISQIAHSDEALLAALAIFLWHFYNVHLRPTVFPMSPVWLTGKMSAEALYEEHRAEYERQYGTAPPAPAKVPSTWHQHYFWSYIGVIVVLVAATVVVAADYRSVRSDVLAIGSKAKRVEQTMALAAMPRAHDKGVYDEGFDVFARCTSCHRQDRVDAGTFPHKRHFEKGRVASQCAGCHELRFHQSLKTRVEGCFKCHDISQVKEPRVLGKPSGL